MRRLGLVVIVVACSRDRQSATAGSGSVGSAKPIAIADAAPPDAPKLATEIWRPCDVAGAGVHCVITPKDGALRGKRCWSAVVAIEDHVAAKLRMVTSAPACTGDIAMGVATPLELTFGVKDDLKKACAADNACEVMLSDVDELTKNQAAWRAQVQAQLTDEKTEREQAARDREPAEPGAFEKIYEHYVKLSIDDELDTRWKEHPDRREVEMSIRSAGPMIMIGVIPDNAVLTKGQVSCALPATSAAGYRECFAAAVTDDAGVDDAGVPGD